MTDTQLNEQQLSTLTAAFHDGARDASQALAAWIGKPSVIEVDSVRQTALADATSLIAEDEEALVCFCAARIAGPMEGDMLFVFEQESGLALVDMLLDQPVNTTKDWTEMGISAAEETTNILCCAYLNAISVRLSHDASGQSLLPSPPEFNREFAASLVQFALMGQALNNDQVITVNTRFEIDGSPLNWTLLLVPTAETIARLPELLGPTGPESREASS